MLFTMLPLSSSMTTTLMNWTSLTNNVTACGLLLSKISKSSFARSGNEPSGGVGHGREERHGLNAGPEHRGLLRSRRCDGRRHDESHA